MDNKMKILNEIFKENNAQSPIDQLNLMEAFQELLDDGYVEKFINDKGETDYRLSNKYEAGKIIKDIKND